MSTSFRTISLRGTLCGFRSGATVAHGGIMGGYEHVRDYRPAPHPRLVC